ncbi:MAG: Na/Pi symporter, partial [Kangiellaceae bacterium]|nr:Na/Pi symporter [Kangiellaceae bacterium]
MIDGILFLSGLVIFLYALERLEHAVSQLNEQRLKALLESSTHSPILGIIFGIVSTSLLQSSSLVGLLVLAFVASKMLPFRNAIGIIL